MKKVAVSPYTMDEPPTSAGRVLLARAFEYWCALHHGYGADDIVAAFGPKTSGNGSLRKDIQLEARLLGETFASGEIHTWARALGGGAPVPIQPTDWELDDFSSRFAASAFDPARPFDDGTRPTHWIFLELADFNRMVELSCPDVPKQPKPARFAAAPTTATTAPVPESQPTAPTEDRHVRMPEIVRRTGMSTSTVYRRIGEGRFPKQIPMESGNIASWWESEVAEWIANPR